MHLMSREYSEGVGEELASLKLHSLLPRSFVVDSANIGRFIDTSNER